MVHADITTVAFLPVRRSELDSEERNRIALAERLGVQITNRVHVSAVIGDTDLDLVVPPKAQQAWLRAPAAMCRRELAVPRLRLPTLQFARYQQHFARFLSNPLHAETSHLRILNASVEQCTYRAAGEDQVRISTDSLEAMAGVLRNSVVRRAARTLILRLMRKGATLYAKFHCPQLAREVA